MVGPGLGFIGLYISVTGRIRTGGRAGVRVYRVIYKRYR